MTTDPQSRVNSDLTETGLRFMVNPRLKVCYGRDIVVELNHQYCGYPDENNVTSVSFATGRGFKLG